MMWGDLLLWHLLKKNNNKEIKIQSSAAKYLTYVASIGYETEVRYEDRKVSNEITRLHAETEYEKYWIIQDK